MRKDYILNYKNYKKSADKWRKKNRIKFNKIHAEAYQTLSIKDKYLRIEQIRKWQNKNKDKCKEYIKKYRAKLKKIKLLET